MVISKYQILNIVYNKLKGDGSIKNIKFLNVGYNNNYQVYVKIYDEFNNIIFNDWTYNGEINLYLNNNKIYKIEANFLNERIKQYFYTNKRNYIFLFKHSFLSNRIRTITFSLKDYYYNLPIMKGEIILWKNQ